MPDRAALRQSATVARAGQQAKAKAVTLYERNWQDRMGKRIAQYKKELGYEWGEPETLNQMALTEWLEARADVALSSNQAWRLKRIDRAIATMQGGGYVRPSRSTGKKLGLGE